MYLNNQKLLNMDNIQRDSGACLLFGRKQGLPLMKEKINYNRIFEMKLAIDVAIDGIFLGWSKLYKIT